MKIREGPRVRLSAPWNKGNKTNRLCEVESLLSFQLYETHQNTSLGSCIFGWRFFGLRSPAVDSLLAACWDSCLLWAGSIRLLWANNKFGSLAASFYTLNFSSLVRSRSCKNKVKNK